METSLRDAFGFQTVGLRNYEGAPTYRRPLYERVIQVVTTGTLSDTFYASKQQIQAEAIEALTTMRDLDPVFLAQALVYGRNVGLLKDVNILGLVILSTAKNKGPFKAAFNQIIQTPDDLIRFVEICRSKQIRQGLGGVARDIVHQWLTSMTEFHAVKYSGSGKKMSLRDVINMAHPKSEDPAADERLGWLVYGWSDIGDEPSPTNPQIWWLEKLKRAETTEEVLEAIEHGQLPWEVAVPAVKATSTEFWVAMMRQMPYLALLRNLNTLARHEVLQQPDNVQYVADRLTNAEALVKAKVLPFRLFSAWKAYAADPISNPAIVAALETALESSFVNLPALPGMTAIGTDVSGSMQSEVSPRGSTRFVDIGAIFTAALIKQAGSTVVLPFNGYVIGDIRLMASDSLLTNAEKIANLCGGGTAVGAPIQFLLDRGIRVDTFVGITDNEDWCYKGYYGYGEPRVRGSFLEMWRAYRDKVNPEAQAFLVTIAPYKDAVAPAGELGVHFIYGWSEQVLQYIAMTLNGTTSQLDAVRSIQL